MVMVIVVSKEVHDSFIAASVAWSEKHGLILSNDAFLMRLVREHKEREEGGVVSPTE